MSSGFSGSVLLKQSEQTAMRREMPFVSLRAVVGVSYESREASSAERVPTEKLSARQHGGDDPIVPWAK